MKVDTMNKHFARVGVAVALSLVAASAIAADTDSQTVQITIPNISQIDVAAGPIALTVAVPAAGSAPTAVTATSTYAITTNASEDGKALQASIGSNITATGVTLGVKTATPGTGTTNADFQTLSTTAITLVSDMQGTNAASVTLTYQLVAGLNALPTGASTLDRTVTYTIVDQ
jgi:hypothetical protein